MKCCSPGGKKLPGLQFLEGVVRHRAGDPGAALEGAVHGNTIRDRIPTKERGEQNADIQPQTLCCQPL